MKTLTVHPQNKEQAKAIEAVLKALKIPYEKLNHPEKFDSRSKSQVSESNELYNPDWEKMMKQSAKEIEEGKGIKMSIKELEDLWK
ncbi:DUF2683 family protein [Membranihabitans maritimus]|uniref:DUF2683 family protein n=1 Tax=Membranihabitans maritimus TaxID=2904244 RepID=UPI001F39CB53|nr:DUF2683 family protein [Membranihabitans maritimus]